MNKKIDCIIKAYNVLDCEFAILSENELLYKSNNYEMIKNESIAVEKDLFAYDDKYYEYLKKKIDDEYYVVIYQDVTKYQKRILMLKEDVLTTLPNRYAIELFLNNNISNNMIAVICDLDDFKNINDTYGHLQGDAVLRSFGIILKKMLSQNIFVGRYGGEEFVLFFQNVDLKYVKEQLFNIRKLMKLDSNLCNDKYNTTMSSGISIMSDNNLKLAIKEADIALYYVKNNGKNADAIYDQKTNNCYIIE